MCKQFVDRLNEDIKLLVRILDSKEFVVLVERACRVEELGKEKRKADSEARDSRKRLVNKPYHSSSKKSRDSYSRSNALLEYSNRYRGKQFTSSKIPATSMASMRKINLRVQDKATRLREEVHSVMLEICIDRTRSTHSYICVNLVSSKNLLLDSTKFVIKVLCPLGKYVLVDKVCKNSPLMTRGYYFMADLILLPFDEFDEFDVILKYVKKGCNAYLAYVLDTNVSETKIESIPVVCEYPDVFPEELPGLPPIRDVEFAFDLVLGTSPILIAPYRMAPTKLKELKTQLKELTDRGFARSSFFP
ncbi:DNA/RNA polymerases superfamily protein [Gossypium australe]|uniref:DNA/RNA polymerases superfamily protein n=1 Tax=Gossypium australe TaxID=47621 RepID=A0A5B6V9U1_9ROSI|nr:DNA/RNA polymerases superfamily protein [Gossypium australe]